jgi:CubicO group peptidase (beta-lactamase class C family)
MGGRMLAAWALVVLAAGSGRAQSGGLPAVESFVLAEMQRQQVPGLAVAIVRRGEVILAKGYGLANVEHQVRVGPETIFQSGSLGKQFTATVVMLLVEEGKLALDDSITKYLKDAPSEWEPITVRHLLTHTSGIPDYTEGAIDLRRDYSEDELAKAAYHLKLEFPAGSRWNYSNTGYLLLGIIIHRASGQFYGDILHDRVFAPLGMNTARVISEEDIVPHRAAGYRFVAGRLKNQEWVSPSLNTTADGSLYFSLRDLIAWDRGLRAKALLRAESWAQIYDPAKLTSGRRYPYGFGWEIEEVAGHKVDQHAGAWQGFESFLARYVEDELTIIVLANLAEADLERFVDGIAGLIDPALKPPELRPIADHEPEVTARFKDLLAAASQGRLKPEEFAYVRAGFFPDRAKAYLEMLRALGGPSRIDLLRRQELGDDRVYTYQVAYQTKMLVAVLGIAPNGKFSQFSIRPK